MDNDDKDVDSKELRSKTQELVEKMQLKQKGLSKCLQETLEVLNSSQDCIFEKTATVDKSLDMGHVKGLSQDMWVRSYDLTQLDTAKQKLVALAKRHPKNHDHKSSGYDSTSEVQDEDSPVVQGVCYSDVNGLVAAMSSACQDPIWFEPSSNDIVNNFEVLHPQVGSAFVENPSSEKLATRRITPNSVKRRRIIDKNVRVRSGEILERIEQEHDLGLGLNYSYSGIGSDSDSVGEAVSLSDSDEPDYDKHVERYQQGFSHDKLSASSNERTKTSIYEEILGDPGNIKRPENLSLKQAKQNKGRCQTMQTTVDNRFPSNQRLKSKEYKLLGYDWIASVLDNKEEASLEISDDYFEELREFWKEQHGRSINDLNLLKKFVDDSDEHQLIQDILAESKIQSYQINNRLFPELARKKNISGKETEDRLGIENKRPAFVSPRYVSVTVPNNTVKVSSATRSHRRGSVDSSETLSLGKHCVTGWESSRLNVPPTGTTLSMKDATSVSKTKQVLTLEEAEELASGNRPRGFSRYFADKTNILPTCKFDLPTDQSLPPEKNIAKDKRSDFLKRVADMTNPPENSGPNSSVKSTSELLDSAYSLMRDLDRIKQEHKMKRLAKTDLGGIP